MLGAHHTACLCVARCCVRRGGGNLLLEHALSVLQPRARLGRRVVRLASLGFGLVQRSPQLLHLVVMCLCLKHMRAPNHCQVQPLAAVRMVVPRHLRRRALRLRCERGVGPLALVGGTFKAREFLLGRLQLELRAECAVLAGRHLQQWQQWQFVFLGGRVSDGR